MVMIGTTDEMNLHVPQSIEAEVDIMVNSRYSGLIVTPQRNAPVNGPVQDALVAITIITMVWGVSQMENLQEAHVTEVSRKTALRIYGEFGVSKERLNCLLIRAQKYYPDNIIALEEIYEEPTDGEDSDLDELNTQNYILQFTEKIPGSLFVSILFPNNFCYEKIIDDPIISDRPRVEVVDGILLLLHLSAPLCKKSVGAKGGSMIHDLWKRSQELALTFISDLLQLTYRWLPTHGFTIGIKDCFASKEEDVAKTLIEARMKVSEIISKYRDSKDHRDELKMEIEIREALNKAMTIGPLLAKNSMFGGDRNALNIMRLSGAKGSVINLAQIVAFVGQQNIKGQRMPQHLTHGTRCLTCFLPGDNSPDARGFIENNYLRGLTPSEAFFHAAAGREGSISTAMKTSDSGYGQKKIARKMEDAVLWIDGTVRDANGRIINFLYGDDGMDSKKIMNIKGLQSPFFVNPVSVANKLNSDARRLNEVMIDEVPREMSEDEIDMLLSFIIFSHISTPVTKTATENARNNLRKVMCQVRIYECKIPDLFVEIRDAFDSSKAPYGMAVGLIATSCLGEPSTQMTLNVFHTCGVAGRAETSGVPRLKQLINVTKTKDQTRAGCIVYLDSEILKKNSEELNNLVLRCKSDLDSENLSSVSASISDIPHIDIEQRVLELKKSSLEVVHSMRRQLDELFVGSFIEDYEMRYTAVDPSWSLQPSCFINL